MLIGLVLGGATVSLTGTDRPAAVHRQGGLAPAFLALTLPFVVLAVPFADLAMAVLRRTWAGRSPFAPGQAAPAPPAAQRSGTPRPGRC